jgi:hypothetical protein
MKRLLITAAAILAFAGLHAAIPTGLTSVTLAWDSVPDATNYTYVIAHSTNAAAPLTNWTVIATVPATNQVTFQIVPGSHFFAAYSSNFWGTSDFSNVAWTPPVPSDTNHIVIRLGN